MVRSPFYDKNGVKKGAWSREEDDKLRHFIQRYGHRNWRQLPKFAGLARCGKSCRLRWMNYLKPNLKHGNYSQEEEGLIIKLHQQLGNKWSLIAKELPGRTDNEVKNHWHSHLKKKKNKGLKLNHDTKSESKSKSSEYTESGSPSVFVGAESESHPILESSLVAQDNYSSITSSSNAAEAAMSMKWSREEDSVASWETSSDFWSRPFMVENSSTYYEIAPVFSYPSDCSDLSDLLDW